MFEENENLVTEEVAENVEEQPTEEVVEGADATEEVTEEKSEKVYTEEELNKKLDELLAKKIARKEAKIRKDLEKEYQPYKELGTVVNAGLGVEDVTEATNNLKEFYTKKGINIPKITPTLSESDMKVLANAEVEDIISTGFDEVVEEVDRLAKLGADNMTPREKLVFTRLAEYRKAEESRKELASIGVTEDYINSEEFKEFASQFNPRTSIKKIYELYNKTIDKKPIENMGSMKGGTPSKVKDFYTADEIERLTDEELDNPKIWDAVRNSMTGRA